MVLSCLVNSSGREPESCVSGPGDRYNNLRNWRPIILGANEVVTSCPSRLQAAIRISSTYCPSFVHVTPAQVHLFAVVFQLLSQPFFHLSVLWVCSKNWTKIARSSWTIAAAKYRGKKHGQGLHMCSAECTKPETFWTPNLFTECCCFSD